MTKKDPSRLVDNILGKGMREKLELRESQLSAMAKNMQANFDELTDSFINNSAILSFMNGRVDPLEFELAKKVVKAVERDLFLLHRDIRKVKNMKFEIGKVLESINASRESENKVLQVEGFLERMNAGIQGQHNATMYVENMPKIKTQARLLEHSAAALIELKVGK